MWMGKPPKRRGRLGKIFFRIGVANRWTHIVLSYRVRRAAAGTVWKTVAIGDSGITCQA